MRLIDAHMHLGLLGWTEKKLLKYLDEQGIEKAWVLTWDEMKPAVAQYYMSLDLEVVRKSFKSHPDRIVPFYAPDPARKEWKKTLQRCLDDGFAGCAELKVSYRWNDEILQPLLEYLDEQKLPLIFHMEQARELFIPDENKKAELLMSKLLNQHKYSVLSQSIRKISKESGIMGKYLSRKSTHFPGYLLDFKELEETVSKYQGITFIGHGPHIWNNFSIPKKDYLVHQRGPFRGEGLLWKLLGDYENFFCDISGFSGFNAMNRDHKASVEFLGRFNRKILYGTDNYTLGLFKLLESFGLEEEHKENIYYQNAKNIAG